MPKEKPMKKHKAGGGRGKDNTLFDWEACLASAKAGDAHALAELCERVLRRSEKYAQHEGLPKNYSSEDFAQDVVQRFLLQLPGIHFLRSWLAGVCVYARADLFRQYALRRCSSLEQDTARTRGAALGQFEFSSRDDEEIEGRVNFDFLLGNLTKIQRDIIVLRLVDGLPYAEIAKILNKSELAVRASFVRSKKRLRAIVAPKPGEGYSHGLDSR